MHSADRIWPIMAHNYNAYYKEPCNILKLMA